jgi:hypothetical protein
VSGPQGNKQRSQIAFCSNVDRGGANRVAQLIASAATVLPVSDLTV